MTTRSHRQSAAAAAVFLLSTVSVHAQHELEPTSLPNAAPTGPAPAPAPAPTNADGPTALPTYGPASDQTVDIIFVTVLGGIIVILLFYFWTGWMLYERDVEQRMLKVPSFLPFLSLPCSDRLMTRCFVNLFLIEGGDGRRQRGVRAA